MCNISTCNICQSYRIKQDYCEICKISICRNCLIKWIKLNNTCPICRKNENLIYDIKKQPICFKNKVYPEVNENKDTKCKDTKCKDTKCIISSILINYLLGYLVINIILLIIYFEDYKEKVYILHTTPVIYIMSPLVGLSSIICIAIICSMFSGCYKILRGDVSP